MSVKLLTEHNLEILSLTGGCTGSYEYTLVKMPHCWKSHATANISYGYAFAYITVPVVIFWKHPALSSPPAICLNHHCVLSPLCHHLDHIFSSSVLTLQPEISVFTLQLLLTTKNHLLCYLLVLLKCLCIKQRGFVLMLYSPVNNFCVINVGMISCLSGLNQY